MLEAGMTIRQALERAIAIAGSEAKLGRLTGFTQNAIWQAKVRGTVSARMARRIEQAVNVPAADLCPEVFGEAERVAS